MRQWPALSATLIKRAARLAIETAAQEPIPPCLELSLLLTGDEGIRALNQQFRDIDEPTDVLSFPQLQMANGKWQMANCKLQMAGLVPKSMILSNNQVHTSDFVQQKPGRSNCKLKKTLNDKRSVNCLLLGDVVISLSRAAAQAEEYGHSREREAVFLLVHGLLHLLGYDHERSLEDEMRMFTLQGQIMDELTPLLEGLS